jgi:hypothetical protein
MRNVTVDWCRHCTKVGDQTLEHLPPRSAGNDQPIRLANPPGGIIREFTEGHAIPVLCDDCNGGASNRGLPGAYKLWRNDVIEAVKTATIRESHGRAFDIWGSAVEVGVDHDYALHPGRVARQVLGMLLAVQDSPDLVREHPQLQAAYFSDDAASIAPLSLHVALANTNFAYLTNALVTGQMDLRTGIASHSPMRLWCFTPFVATLLEGGPMPWPTTRIDMWLELPTSYHFRKRDRDVTYPVANRSHPVIEALYRGSAHPTTP